jgi:hypothetical protein
MIDAKDRDHVLRMIAHSDLLESQARVPARDDTP